MVSFSYTWNSPPGGIYSIRANWSGDSDYIGSDSSISRIVIVPFEWLIMGGTLILFLIILVIVVLATRGSGTPTIESYPEWDSDEYDY